MSNQTKAFELKNSHQAQKKLEAVLYWIKMTQEEQRLRDIRTSVVIESILDFAENKAGQEALFNAPVASLVDAARSKRLTVISVIGLDEPDRYLDGGTKVYEGEVVFGLNGLDSNEDEQITLTFSRSWNEWDGASVDSWSAQYQDEDMLEMGLDEDGEVYGVTEDLFNDYLLDKLQYVYEEFSPSNPDVSDAFLSALDNECDQPG